jgi:electron transfer flavoprotein beta subunit
MGADRGIVVDANDVELDAQRVAELVAKVFEREKADLLVAGKLSQDNEGNEVGQRVAGLLGLPQATFAASVEWDQAANAMKVSREVDDGVETKRIPLPAVISCDLRVVLPHSVKNGETKADHAYQEGPRLASLRGITMAKRKKVDVLTPEDLGVELGSGVRAKGVVPPPARQAGQRVESVEQLVEKLTTEAKVL